MLAIVKIGGSQYAVEPEKKLTVTSLPGKKAGDSVVFDQVLLIANGDKVTLGKPTVPGAKVQTKVIRNGRGPKVIVFKYKSKTRYRKKQGFRAEFTELEIEKITA